MMNYIALLLIVSSAASASEVTKASKTTKITIDKSAENLPHCVNDSNAIEDILAKMKNNSKTKLKYDGYRKALASDSDQEITARLIYTETKAANCATQNEQVMPLIAGVINNRIQIRHGDVKSVVFERNQFASSLNNYSSSKYKEFLCPNDPLVWQQAMMLAGQSSPDLPRSAVNYFLYKHHPGWDKEPWKLPEAQASVNSKARDCVRVFENKGWK